MSENTLTRNDLCEEFSNLVGLSRQQSTSILEAILDGLCEGLVQDGHVKISSFGSFRVLEKSSRVGRNPKTGETVMIEPRKSLSFHASHILKAHVARR